MENRDFRDRLRNHTRETSPAAWEQMEGLLDSLPKKDKKKRKGGFWFFFLGIGLIALIVGGYGIWNFTKQNQTKHSLSENLPQEIGQLDKKSGATLASDAINKEAVTQVEIGGVSAIEEVISKRIAEVNAKGAEETDQSESRIGKGDIEDLEYNNEEKINSRSRREINTEVKNPGGNFISDGSVNLNRSIESTDDAHTESTKNGEESETVLNDGTLLDERVNVSSELEKREMKEGEEMNGLNKYEEQGGKNAMDEPIVDKNEAEIEESNKERGRLMAIDRLPMLQKGVGEVGDRTINPIPEVYVNKPMGVAVFVGGGKAWFNNNPGFTISAGSMYSIDRIIDLEGNFGFSYGSEQGIPEGEEFTWERQFDVNFLIHLNLIKNRTFKLSLIAGAGHTFYTGRRIIRSEPIFINERSSSGRNLQGAVEFNVRLRDTFRLGIRAGVISYDDAVTYISPRFYYDF